MGIEIFFYIFILLVALGASGGQKESANPKFNKKPSEDKNKKA